MTTTPGAPPRWCPTCQDWRGPDAFACPTCGALTVQGTSPADRPYVQNPTPTPPGMQAYQPPPQGYGPPQQQPPPMGYVPPQQQPQQAYPPQAFPAPGMPGQPGTVKGGRGPGLIIALVLAVLVIVGVIVAVAVGGGGTKANDFLNKCVVVLDAGGGRRKISRTVDCSESNNGKVVKVVSDEADCPTGTDETFKTGGKLLCLDEDA